MADDLSSYGASDSTGSVADGLALLVITRLRRSRGLDEGLDAVEALVRALGVPSILVLRGEQVKQLGLVRGIGPVQLALHLLDVGGALLREDRIGALALGELLGRGLLAQLLEELLGAGVVLLLDEEVERAQEKDQALLVVRREAEHLVDDAPRLLVVLKAQLRVEAHVEQVVARVDEAHQRAVEKAQAPLEVTPLEELLVAREDQALLDLRVEELDDAERHQDDAYQLPVHAFLSSGRRGWP